MKPRALTLALGAALIVVANGIALTGVALNRSGEPESRMTLTQRELGRPWNWYSNKENSGLSLRIEWRVPDLATETYYYGSHGGTPAWLDEKRMAELGFDVERIKGSDARRDKYISQSEREVLVVLELAGDAWRQTLERARQRLAHQESLRRATPEAKELIEAEKRARESLEREETVNSRLFAVDVGTELSALRTKYPDRDRYLILRGKLRPYATLLDKKLVVTGYLDQLSVHQINVPHALRSAFETMPSRTGGPADKRPAFTAVVAVGRRLEPWIETVSAP